MISTTLFTSQSFSRKYVATDFHNSNRYRNLRSCRFPFQGCMPLECSSPWRKIPIFDTFCPMLFHEAKIDASCKVQASFSGFPQSVQVWIFGSLISGPENDMFRSHTFTRVRRTKAMFLEKGKIFRFLEYQIRNTRK